MVCGRVVRSWVTFLSPHFLFFTSWSWGPRSRPLGSLGLFVVVYLTFGLLLWVWVCTGCCYFVSGLLGYWLMGDRYWWLGWSQSRSQRVRESQDLSIYYYYLGVNDGDHVNSVYFCWYWSNVFIAPVFAGICRCGRWYTNFCLCNFLIDP